MAATIIYYQYYCISGFLLSINFSLLAFVLLNILSVLKAKMLTSQNGKKQRSIYKSKYRNVINPC